jgi:hypothetical protein
MDLSGAASAPVDPTQKLYWGPRLWNLLHCLAEISDRRDMVMLWNQLMRLTAAVMPCEQCRIHLSNYMRTHVFVRFQKIHLVTGEMVKTRAVTELFNLHNEVNARLEKPAFTNDDMSVYKKSRPELLSTINQAYDEIKMAWTPLVHSRINGSVFTDWKKHLNMMIALASGGPN